MFRIIISIISTVLIGWWLKPPPAFAEKIMSGAKLSKVHLKNCTQDSRCVEIEALQATEGFIVRGIAFGNATLKISSVAQSTAEVWEANNVFWDYESNRLFIEGLQRNPNNEAIYDLNLGQLKRF